jgi:hypothetical protein
MKVDEGVIERIRRIEEPVRTMANLRAAWITLPEKPV